jgi:beta-lactamase superfamily II metal-dependent hydrolase
MVYSLLPKEIKSEERMSIFAKAAIGLAAAGLLFSARSDAQTSGEDLQIASIDVEGGSAVLFRTPEGKSLLIDTGWRPGICNQAPVPKDLPRPSCPISADAIAKAAAKLGITHLDYLFMTHYHADHIGGLDALLAKLPVDTFVDHGPNRQSLPPDASPRARANSTEAGYAAWQAAYKDHDHITAQVGQVIDIGSLHVRFVASDGNLPDAPLPGAGQSNALCTNVAPNPNDGGEENVRSLGMLMTFGKTRILYLGDLTWNMELKLLCPVNLIGKTDVYFVTGHGMDLSSSPPTAAFDPLVAVMQNGPTKGGDEAVIKTVESYPHLEGFWRTHYSVRYPDLNGDPNYIANLNVLPDSSYPIDLDITPGGNITVTNPRNDFSKTYTARAAQ